MEDERDLLQGGGGGGELMRSVTLQLFYFLLHDDKCVLDKQGRVTFL